MISIVVCTYNGASRILPCLDSLITQQNAPPHEILVVDNASIDETADLVEKCLKDKFSDGDWKVLKESKSGLLHARLKGLEESKYDWVLFCDDDNVLFPDFLSVCQKLLIKGSKLGVLGSHGIPEFENKKPEWFDSYSSSYAVGPQLKNTNLRRHLDYVYGASSIYRKKGLLELFSSGFLPILSDRKGNLLVSGGDVEWCALMQLLGYQIAYSPRLKFYHQIPQRRLTWDYYLKLKKGITSGAGLLFPYHYFFESTIHNPVAFRWAYLKETAKAGLLFLKYSILWKGKPSSPENQLAYLILGTKFRSFKENRRVAIRHFKQICRHFGT